MEYVDGGKLTSVLDITIPHSEGTNMVQCTVFPKTYILIPMISQLKFN